jgi:hypothetical protein
MIENLIEFTDPILQIEGLPPVEARKLYKNRLRCHFLPVKTFLVFCGCHPPTQETTPMYCNTLRLASTALAVRECVNGRYTISAINLSCFGGFRSRADDPPKPWHLRSEASFSAQGRRWVWFWETTGLPVGLHVVISGLCHLKGYEKEYDHDEHKGNRALGFLEYT